MSSQEISRELSGTQDNFQDLSGALRNSRGLPGALRDGGRDAFDGDNDAVVLPKVEFMDSPQSFSISMWFKRLEDNQSTPTNNNISNVLFAQSSAATNDNLEIGTAGSEVHVYLDNGPDQSLVTSLAGVTNGIWHHLVFVYGNCANSMWEIFICLMEFVQILYGKFLFI